jgi:cytosine deaminase
LPNGRVAEIGCRGGRIAEIGALAGRAAGREILAEGRAVTAGLVDAHIHLDKALLGARAPSRLGTVAEAIRVTGEAKRRFTRPDIADRARRALDMAVRQGTTAMRSHVEVDPIVGLMGFEAILPLRREYAPAIDLQLCAFAQEGILQMPGTEALLREALRMGADLVGGVPYNDTDAHRHIAIVFDLAAEFGVDVDFHADFFDEPQHLHALHIAEETIRRGWQGRVALDHMSEMAALPPGRAGGWPARCGAGGRRGHRAARDRSLPDGAQGRADRPPGRPGQAAARGGRDGGGGDQQRAQCVHRSARGLR